MADNNEVVCVKTNDNGILKNIEMYLQMHFDERINHIQKAMLKRNLIAEHIAGVPGRPLLVTSLNERDQHAKTTIKHHDQMMIYYRLYRTSFREYGSFIFIGLLFNIVFVFLETYDQAIKEAQEEIDKRAIEEEKERKAKEKKGKKEEKEAEIAQEIPQDNDKDDDCYHK